MQDDVVVVELLPKSEWRGRVNSLAEGQGAERSGEDNENKPMPTGETLRRDPADHFYPALRFILQPLQAEGSLLSCCCHGDTNRGLSGLDNIRRLFSVQSEIWPLFLCCWTTVGGIPRTPRGVFNHGDGVRLRTQSSNRHRSPDTINNETTRPQVVIQQL